MGKRVGRIPVEVNIAAPQDNHIPIFDLETRLWDTISTGSLFSGIFTGSNSFSGSQVINGDLTVSGSIYAYNITSSLFGTASVSLNSISASYLSGSQGIVNTFTSSGDISVRNIVISAGKLVGPDNISIGSGSLVSTSSIPVFGGDNNIAIGNRVLAGPIVGSGNTAIGYSALRDYTASYSTAIGSYALWKSVGGRNTAVGQGSLPYFVTGTFNTAVGDSTMFYTTIATNNTAIGNSTLRDFREGNENTTVGSGVLYLGFLTGSANTVIGFRSGEGVVTGSNNTIIGANVIGLPSVLNNNIIIADGQGNIRARYSSSMWTLAGSVIGNFTGSLLGTASWANNSISSSYPIAVSGSTIYTPFNIVNFSRFDSIFFGNSAGQNATNANSSNFLGYYAGYSATNAENSNFLGQSAGNNATGAYNANFLGQRAGLDATNARHSNFLGQNAGNGAIDSRFSNFLGVNAGSNATSANSSNFLGVSTGRNATNANSSNFLGNFAGENATVARYSNFLGEYSGRSATNANNSNFLGNYAGYQATNSNRSNFLGDYAGYQATNTFSSNFLGSNAGYQATNAYYSNFLGEGAGRGATNAINSTFIGFQAGYYAASASYSILIGYRAGVNPSFTLPLGVKSNNIIIGNNITLNAERQDSINLGGLIFGTGSYSIKEGNAFSGSANGRIGINQPLPIFELDVAGSGRYTNGLQVSGSLVAPNITGSLFGTASWALNAVSTSYALTASNAPNYLPLTGGTINGDVVVNGTASISFLNVLYESASVIYSSGSNQFGDAADDTQTLYGTILIPTGSIIITGSIFSTNGITSSLFGTASWANNAISSSNSLTASYVINAISSSQAQNAISSSFPIAVTGSTLRSVSPASGVGGSTNGSIFLGLSAGTSATNANSSNFLGNQAGLFAISASNSNFLGFQAGRNAINAFNSNFLGNQAGYQATSASNSNFLGNVAGYRATRANNSNFIGFNAGGFATDASSSNFIGDQAGGEAASANNSNFIGNQAGRVAASANNSNFLGSSAGFSAISASNSNFLGPFAGYYATNANNSNFIGTQAGGQADNASYSTLIGYNVGRNVVGAGLSIKSNNIIIGTNITLASERQDSINLGGLIFGTGSYSTTTGEPFSGSSNGRIGINQPLPIFSLDVSGSGRYTNGLQVTGSLNAPIITGSLFGTASWANNALTASYIDAANVQGLSLFRIATGSISASLGTSPEKLFLINSGSVNYFNISSSGNAEVYSNLFIVKNFTTNQPVFTVSQSIVKFATQSLEPTGTTDAGSIWFTATNMYIGLE